MSVISSYTTNAVGEEAMVDFGAALGAAISGGAVIFLEGDLGMGKTTLSRGVLSAYGYHGVVKSPTYTLVEPYELAQKTVYHFDLYRLGDPEELEYMGIRDYFDGEQLCLVEWALKAQMFLPTADIVVRIDAVGAGRRLELSAQTVRGQAIVAALPQLR
ncbi:MAG: tRNA threonylcarbamoyladenosine biosynthesis protein TsaE [Paraglaciecola psychrophila]|jgi:tRNA threonylcarbamoyladenosine biosynthesis protein TsaE